MYYNESDSDSDSIGTYTYEYNGESESDEGWTDNELEEFNTTQDKELTKGDKKWIKMYTDKVYLEYLDWDDTKHTLKPIRGLIYHIYSLESEKHIFMYFNDVTKFKKFIRNNWYWYPESSVIELRRNKILPSKIYISYKVVKEDVEELFVYTSKTSAQDNFKQQKRRIWNELDIKTDIFIDDEVRRGFIESKTHDELKNMWDTIPE